MSTLNNDQAFETSNASPIAWIYGSLMISLSGIVGSIWLSIGMDLKACPLCLYQRTFLMSVGGVLLTGLLSDSRNLVVILQMALPLTTGGLLTAIFHVYLEAVGTLECPRGVFGLGSGPQQSLCVFVLLVILNVSGALRGAANGKHSTTIAVGLIVGVVLSIGAIASAPPMPTRPNSPYEKPIDTCRPPFEVQPQPL